MIELTVPAPPPEVLRRITTFGSEWRESKIPPKLRERSITGARTRVDGNNFMLWMQPPTRGANYLMKGTVSAASDGCVLQASLTEAPWSRRLGFIWLFAATVLFVGIALSDPGPHSGTVAIVLGMVTVAYSIRVALIRQQRSRAEPDFQLVLAEAVNASASPAT